VVALLDARLGAVPAFVVGAPRLLDRRSRLFPSRARRHRTTATGHLILSGRIKNNATYWLVDALRAQRVHQLEDRLAAGPLWQDTGLVFTSGSGRPLDERNVTRVFERLLAAADLPRVRFHDLRHSCASLLLAQGVAPRVVMEILGHSQISITMDTYSHVIPTLAQDAVDRVAAAIAARA